MSFEYRGAFGRLKLIAPPVIPEPAEAIADPLIFARVEEELRASRRAYAREWSVFHQKYTFNRRVRISECDLGRRASKDEIEAVRAAGGRPALYELLLGPIEHDACRIQLVDWDDLERDIRQNGVVKAVLGDNLTSYWRGSGRR